MRIAESLRTKCANKQELAIVFLEVLSSGFATARPDSGDDGRNGAIHDDEWSPLIGIFMPAKLDSPWRVLSVTTAGLMAAGKKSCQESYGVDAINGSGSVAPLETRQALQRTVRDEFIEHK
ncbi:hypothetical protein YC2023_122198 [Brassica napus]